MNWDQIEGKWDQFKAKAHQKWAKLTDDDWEHLKGRKDELRGKIQERYGYQKDQADRELDDFANSIDADEMEHRKAV
jgi:uncharacterized protein YjbJ (UPF0337 family)